ncbi:phosphatidylinositol-glycan biosynthesis class S protein [Xylaria bambusicola]|uniref:phosphatidylinositol-glycan biosynthesis class S protein n=1 Tax=Xylaria bambusicola TaxID=326684 RepID=UPI0020078D82|nr:phosphatidylinositol-glycan biosynthesis class S protein [Xylaria bambusicola]KAI0506640.1 phosphatidylinositol-glycan biosynthesis class S protein [Xylaria bambusicola]
MSSSTIRNRKDGSAISEADATTSSTSLGRGSDIDITSTATATAETEPIAPSPDSTSTETAKRKPPPPEQPSHIFRRSLIIASFWLVVLCLGVPIWWKTTTIYRANLPLDQMMSWADGKSCSPILPIQVAIASPDLKEQEAEDLISVTQRNLDEISGLPSLQLRLESAAQTSLEDTPESHGAHNIPLVLRLLQGNDTVSVPTSSLDTLFPILEITYPPSLRPTSETTSSRLAKYIAAQIHDTFAEEQSILSYFLATSTISADRQQHGSQYGLDESFSKRMTRSMKYSGTYHLTFSLFTSGSSPSSWDIDSAINQYMKPVLDMLKPIHNFTIDTQVQLYAVPGVQSQVLTKEDLSSFINAAEWPLSPSIGGAPTINFAIYIGNQTISLNLAEETTSQSWLVPQWGSVYLLSPPAATHVPAEFLKQPVLTFASHLLSLLGTPQSGSLPMRLSTLTRVRSVDMLLRASSSLGSLARLSLALPSISIPSSVAEGVAKSIHHLELACSTLGSTESLKHARIAETEAERAFFEKSMVGQLYFPDEHKIAVYLPLLGPVGVPLLMGLITELKAWKTRRQQKA